MFTSKPSFDPVTHKTEGSDRLHPYSTSACAHYFFASNTTKEGNISVTWNANFADQKESWSAAETTGAAGHTLADYLSQPTDWYIVVGIRHWNSDWGSHGSQPGEGTDGQGNKGWWENADYYAGRESVIRGGYPYGEIYLDLYEFRDWENSNAKFAVYFFDGNGNHDFSDFSSCVSSKDGLHIVSYELSFNPTNMIGYRYDPSTETPSTDVKWNQTQNLGFYQYGVIGITDWNRGWSDGLATVKISRGSQTIDVVLDNYKRNAEHKSEHYNDYIDLQENDEFVIDYSSNSYHNWDCLPIFDDNFSYNSTSQKIKVEVAGTYSFYFKAYDEGEVHHDVFKEVHHDVFISKPEVAFADAWALSFLADGCETTKSNWSTYAGEYNNLPHSAKTFLLNVEHEPDPEVEFENYFAQAIQRYDYVIYLYGTSTYNDYIGRVNAGTITPKTTLTQITPMKDNTMVVTIVTAVASLAVASTFFILKKKHVK